MGDSKPPQAAVDLVASYARLVGDQVEIVLSDPAIPAAEDAEVVLRRGDVRVSSHGEMIDDERGHRLVVQFPRQDLLDGIWRARMSDADGSRPLGFRLLVQGDRPLVLLWGQKAPESIRPLPRLRRSSEPSASAGPPALSTATATGGAARARRLVCRLRHEVSRRARHSP